MELAGFERWTSNFQTKDVISVSLMLDYITKIFSTTISLVILLIESVAK